MYDFEFIVPIETNTKKLLTRAYDFKKYGFQNLGDLKIKVYLMLSKGNEASKVESGWPDNVDVEIVIAQYTHVAQKIYLYYSEHIQPDRARWYVRVDEDSITDISGLNNTLVRDFDHEREYHLISELNYDVQPVDQTLLTMLGYGHWYKTHPNLQFHVAPPHEHEISITSNAAVQRLKSCDQAQKYLDMRKEFAEGYGDHSMTHALRIAKVYPTLVKFVTHEAELCNLSIYGGFRNHVHWISRDKNPKALTWLDMFNQEPNPNVENQTFFFGPKDGPKRVVYFSPNHTIMMIQTGNGDQDYKSSDTVGMWCNQGNYLAVYSDDNEEAIGMFATQDGNSYEWNDYILKKVNYNKMMA